MAPRSSRDVPSNQVGKFNSQRSDGTVVIDVPSGYSFVVSRAKVESTGVRKLLAEGLRHNELIFWTIRENSEGSEIDQIYCDHTDDQKRRSEWISTKVVYEADESRLLLSTSNVRRGYGSSGASRLIPYDEPHPYSLNGSRDIETVRRRRLYADPSCSTSYEERARRSSQAYEQRSLCAEPGPSRNTQSSHNNTPPPYSSWDNLPLYNGSEEEMDNVVPSRPRCDCNNHCGGRQDSPLSQRPGGDH